MEQMSTSAAIILMNIFYCSTRKKQDFTGELIINRVSGLLKISLNKKVNNLTD